MREYFEECARREGFDVTRHKTGFYLCRSTHKAWRMFQEGLYKAQEVQQEYEEANA